MISKKAVLVLAFVAIALSLGISKYVSSMQFQAEKQRMESLLAPVVEKAVASTPDPKPTLHFVMPGEKSLLVVLYWKSNQDAAIKNDLRESVSFAVRKELSADPGSWGRLVSVIFADEVVLQGWK